MTYLAHFKFTSLAERLADVARPIAKRYFRANYDYTEKEDKTPVTMADIEIEMAIRDVLATEAPSHGILGEEAGGYQLEAEFVWVIDPIDGTKAFVTGKPLFGTLVALLRWGVPVIGIIDQPILAERWVGIDGMGSTLNGKAISVREARPLSSSICYTSAPEIFEPDHSAAFIGLRHAVQWMLYDTDCYAYGLLASGAIDLVLERFLDPYDYCALVPVIRNAGGYIASWSGEPLGLSSDGTVVAATNEKLAAEGIQIITASRCKES